MQKIDWRPIPGYEGFYVVNEFGDVKSLHNKNKNSLHTTRIDRGGYVSVRLSKDNITSTHLVHRLVALAFLPKEEGRDYVNHKNGDKTDNRLINLEFVTHRENVIDAYRKGFNSASKRIVDITTGEIYYSISEAAKAIGLNYNTCCKRLKRDLESFRLRYAG